MKEVEQDLGREQLFRHWLEGVDRCRRGCDGQLWRKRVAPKNEEQSAKTRKKAQTGTCRRLNVQIERPRCKDLAKGSSAESVTSEPER